ncbi:peroxisome biosynthesis protein (Peroxin-10) [Aphelenchoides avenae]|nr:peroxisome biosynthesis protein (Peroxin-10) [Aphelenchus avenae]
MPADSSRQEGAEASEDEDEARQPEESGLLQQPQQEPVVNGENQGRSDGQIVSPDDGEESRTCPICHGELKVPTSMVGCRHTFCAECIAHWYRQQKSCPVCRHAKQLLGVHVNDLLIANNWESIMEVAAFNSLVAHEASDEEEAAEEEFPPFDADRAGLEAFEGVDAAVGEGLRLVNVEPPNPRRRRHVHVPLIQVLLMIGLIILIASLWIPRYIPPSTHTLYPVSGGYR